MKSIIFNTDMVKAILEGRKTQTRRIVKKAPVSEFGTYSFVSMEIDPDVVTTKVDLDCETLKGTYALFEHSEYEEFARLVKAPYKIGDILYVRETWCYEYYLPELTEGETDYSGKRYLKRYLYKESDSGYPVMKGDRPREWNPSIHMPKEAARLFLRVTGVRVERLQEITEEDAEREGVLSTAKSRYGGCKKSNKNEDTKCPQWCNCFNSRENFAGLWENIYAKRGQGWDANPWVWVIEFEVCEKPEGTTCDR